MTSAYPAYPMATAQPEPVVAAGVAVPVAQPMAYPQADAAPPGYPAGASGGGYPPVLQGCAVPVESSSSAVDLYPKL